MRNIFYTRFFNEKITEKVNIILSPQYYWIKKLDSSIKNLKEAKKIAKHLFEFSEKDFFIDAIKIDEELFAIAVKRDLDLKIDKKFINSIRIAQIELKDIECINLPNNYSLRRIDGIFFCFPEKIEKCYCVEEVINKIQLSNYEVPIINDLNIEKKYLNIFYIASILFIVSFLFRGYLYNIKAQEYNIKKESLNKYNLPLTTFQLKAILNSYKNEYEKQMLIKKTLMKLSFLKLKNGEYIKNLKYKHNFSIEIETKRDLTKFFKQNFNIINLVKTKTSLKVVFNVK